nr:MAG TPA: hypothetical protein [Caudoviricetes sp.]
MVVAGVRLSCRARNHQPHTRKGTTMSDEMLLIDALETAVEELSIALEAEGLDFDIEDSPNTNQYMFVSVDESRVLYVTAEQSFDDEPIVFVDIYDVDEDGEEQWAYGDLMVDEVAPWLAKH